MRVVTDPTIQGMSGRFPKSRLVMNHREGKLITHARSYIRPVNEAGQAAFKEKILAVVGTFNAADEAFVTDLTTYVDSYNEQIVDDHELPLSKYSIFVKACFLAAEEQEFDITTLTVDNFGGTEGDLLETLSPTVFNLIDTANLPHMGYVAADLDGTIDGT